MTPLLEARRLRYAYPDGRQALRDCSLSIAAGSRNVLLGANGAGKTTLLQHFNGLLRPASGELRLDGQPFDYSRAGLAALRRRVGLVFQNPEAQLLAPTVAADVSFGPLNLGLPPAEVRQRTAFALAAVGLTALAERPVQHLSHGQKKRACIAGVLAMSPDLILLDEPMAGLDAAMQAELIAVLDRLAAEGVSLLVSTHDVDFAYRWADTLYLLEDGCCTAAFAADAWPEQLAVLRAAGQPQPAVLSLYQQLSERGLAAAPRLPRSFDELLAALPRKAAAPCEECSECLEKSGLSAPVPATPT